MSSSKRFKFPSMGSVKIPLIIRFYDPDIQAKDAHNRTMEQILAWPDTELERCHNYIQMLFPVPEGSAFNWQAPIIDREVLEAFRSRSELRNRMRRAFERMLDFYGFTVSAQPEKDENEQKENAKAGAEEKDACKAEPQGAANVQVTERAAEPTKEKSEVTAQTASPLPSADDAPPASPEPDAPKAIETTAATNTKDKALEKSTTSTSFPPGAHFQTSLFSSYYVVRAPHWHKAFKSWARRFDHNHLRITRILRCLRVLGLQTECDAFFTALKHVFDDPAIRINERSMIYWRRAVTRPLYIAPDDEKVGWLKTWEEEQEEAKNAKTEDKTDDKDGKDEKMEGKEKTEETGGEDE